MILPPVLRTTTRAAALGAAALLLSACAFWTGHGGSQRTSVAIAGPGTIERSARLQQLVDAMDEKAFPNGGPLVLKLSYELAPTVVATQATTVIRAQATTVIPAQAGIQGVRLDGAVENGSTGSPPARG